MKTAFKSILAFMIALVFAVASVNAAARPDSQRGTYSGTCLSGGTDGCLDSLDITGAGTPNTYDLIDGDVAVIITSAGAYFYVFDADGTDAEDSPDVIRPDDYDTAGVWLKVGAVGAGSLGDDECYAFGDGSDFQLCYDSGDDRLELRDSSDTVLGYFGTDGTYTVIGSGNQGMVLDSTPDADGDASGFFAYETVDTNAVGVGACLNLAADGHLDEADASPTGSGGTGPCLYVALETGTGTKLTAPLRSGPTVRNDSWNWTTGAELYLSETQGTLTETAPSTSGALIQSVGFAKTADIVDFHYVGYGRAD